MKSPELENNEVTGDPKHKSLLFDLWQKVKFSGETKEKAAVIEPEIPPQTEASQTVEVPFEKSAASPALVQLYIRWMQKNGGVPQRAFSVEDFCAEPYPETELLKLFFEKIEAAAEKYLERYDKLNDLNQQLIAKYLADQEEKRGQEEAEQPESGQMPDMEFDLSELKAEPPMDGEVVVLTAPDWSAAWCMIFPSLGSGKPVTEEGIRDALKGRDVVFGLFDERIHELAAEDKWMKMVPVALGIPAEPGADAQIIDHFPRDIGTPHFIENAQGIIDFNNLNWLVPIEAGTVICDIQAPTEGKDGTDIRNHTIKSYRGKRPPLPMGENVVLNQEGTELQAKVDGQISFKNGKYQVTNTISIPGNVDHSTGNLNVRGDLVIYGNILAGFHVQASGDITVGGIVEGSRVSAGGSIIVNRGMNGNLVGSLIAGKDIHCKYMENASVQADGDIYMDSIVNCDIFCNGKIVVKSGRGIIIGGNAVAMGGIEAKIIGNKAGRLTVLSIEPTMQFLRAREQTEKELENIDFEIKKLRMATIAGKAALDLRILELKQSRLKRDLEELLEKQSLISQSRILAEKIYPIAQVSINSVVKSLIEPCSGCRIYLDAKEGEIVVSSR